MDVGIVETVSLSVSSNGGFFWQICVIWWKNIWYIFSKFIFFWSNKSLLSLSLWLLSWKQFHLLAAAPEDKLPLGRGRLLLQWGRQNNQMYQSSFHSSVIVLFHIFTFSLSKSFMEISMKAPVFPMLNLRSSKIISILFCCRLSFAQ